jgi:hypothetical protein
MVAVNLIVEHAEAGNPPPIWTGDLALPVIGAVIVVDGVRYEVVSHQYEVSVGVIWQSPVTVVVRPIQG